jgi:hypothetical protein
MADVLDTFMVYNERRRVTSSAKKKKKVGKPLHQVIYTLSSKKRLVVI